MHSDGPMATAAEGPRRHMFGRDSRLLLAAGAVVLLIGIMFGLGAGRLVAAGALPHAAGLRSGTMATLTIRIKTSTGKLVKTLKGTVTTSQPTLSWNFNCALPKGQYRVGAEVSGIACTQ